MFGNFFPTLCREFFDGLPAYVYSAKGAYSSPAYRAMAFQAPPETVSFVGDRLGCSDITLYSCSMSHANLTSLPLDFAEELPELKEVGLRHNLITSFRAATLLPLARNGTRVSLVGNPLTCDCKAAFLLDLPDDWHYPTCAAPDSLLNRNVKELTTVQLSCDATAGPQAEATSTEEGNETS